jgi:SAM-dependent methyltransferase
MLIHDILGLDNEESVYFIEESYAALKNNNLSLQYLDTIRNDPDAEIESVIDENGDIIALVLFNQETDGAEGFHAIFTDLVSSIPFPNESTRVFSGIAGNLKPQKKHSSTRKDFGEAIIEYYSHSLVNRQLCENCHIQKEPYEMVYIPSRRSRLKDIIDKYRPAGNILEICCGNGMSTLPLHEMGYQPLAIDSDRCQICQGLEHDVLIQKRTIVLDAKNLSAFFPENSFDTVVGFMLGTIYSFNRGIWEKIVSEAVNVIKPGGMILLTVNKKEEMEILESALIKCGIEGQMIDNTDGKGIYDQWIYSGKK